GLSPLLLRFGAGLGFTGLSDELIDLATGLQLSRAGQSYEGGIELLLAELLLPLFQKGGGAGVVACFLVLAACVVLCLAALAFFLNLGPGLGKFRVALLFECGFLGSLLLSKFHLAHFLCFGSRLGQIAVHAIARLE